MYSYSNNYVDKKLYYSYEYHTHKGPVLITLCTSFASCMATLVMLIARAAAYQGRVLQ